MREIWKRAGALFLTVLLAAGLLCPGAGAAGQAEEAPVTILFTHDTHSHLLPQADEEGGEYGGYTRLATLLEQERTKAEGAVLTVDGGDFSMGTLFQAVFTTHAAELRMLGAMGYDVTTLGNHEFDYRAQGLADMLNAAADAREGGETLPEIVQANYTIPKDPSDSGSWALKAALERYGIKPYTVVEKDGVRFGVFGIFGKDADETAPMSGMALADPVETAKTVVAELRQEDCDYIICLSHSGTDGKGGGEDAKLAKAVDGIDVIISGHTHSTLEKPLEVNGTFIVSCGEYTQNLGMLTLQKENGETRLADYQLLPVDETVPEAADIVLRAKQFQTLVEEEYLSGYGYTFDQVLADSPFAFTPISQFGKEQVEDSLGNLIADSYVYAVQQAEGEDYISVDFAVVASGVIRGSFAAGEITVSDAFNVSSLGSGADGSPGYPLVSAYLTGKELKDVFEVDASVTPLMPAAQLYAAGMEWSFNPNRMIFDKVTECCQVLPDGSRVPLEDDRLYRVVTGLYSAQMLGAVNGKSFGILTITPKDENGQPITDFEAHIIHDEAGSEVKEWYALASYLESLGTVPGQYSGPEGRKNAEPSWNPVDLLKNPGPPTWIAMAAVAVLIVVVVTAVQLVRHRKKRRREHSEKRK